MTNVSTFDAPAQGRKIHPTHYVEILPRPDDDRVEALFALYAPIEQLPRQVRPGDLVYAKHEGRGLVRLVARVDDGLFIQRLAPHAYGEPLVGQIEGALPIDHVEVIGIVTTTEYRFRV
jgi:hypothetical protein